MVSRTFGYPKECYKQILKVAEKYLEADKRKNRSEETRTIGESYNRLAMFYLQHLSSSNEMQQKTEALIVESVLRAMRYSSKSAQLQFPRLFQLEHIEQPNMMALFNKEVRNHIYFFE